MPQIVGKGGGANYFLNHWPKACHGSQTITPSHIAILKKMREGHSLKEMFYSYQIMWKMHIKLIWFSLEKPLYLKSEDFGSILNIVIWPIYRILSMLKEWKVMSIK